MAQIVVVSPGQTLRWAIARWLAMVGVPLLLAWLVWRPEAALTVLWYVVIPVLPATFFLSTDLWRGICPLATLNEWGNRLGTQRPLPGGMGTMLGVGGLVLFHLMVPARRFLFNENGVVLAGTVAGVGLLALLLGALFEVRSAFCNALCPVLPVELLYGQRPPVRLTRGRCTTCTVCTPRGCLDLSHGLALPQVLGPSRRGYGWLVRPYGLFWAALPGFIVGYSLMSDGPFATAGKVYATTIGLSLVSAALVMVAVTAFRIPSELAVILLAALSGGTNYWFAGPAIASELAAGLELSLTIRVLGMGIVLWWMSRAVATWSRRPPDRAT